jgi:UrcA family protein
MKRFATKMLLLGGLAALAAAGAAGAAESYTDVPTMVVRYNADMLATDSGARALYHRLTIAAEQVCPPQRSETRMISETISNCRKQALAAAVERIHNQRLAAVYARATKSSG